MCCSTFQRSSQTNSFQLTSRGGSAPTATWNELKMRASSLLLIRNLRDGCFVSQQFKWRHWVVAYWSWNQGSWTLIATSEPFSGLPTLSQESWSPHSTHRLSSKAVHFWMRFFFGGRRSFKINFSTSVVIKIIEVITVNISAINSMKKKVIITQVITLENISYGRSLAISIITSARLVVTAWTTAIIVPCKCYLTNKIRNGQHCRHRRLMISSHYCCVRSRGSTERNQKKN